jgi:Putative beta-barrel porin-2, OmpL-like. bbp2
MKLRVTFLSLTMALIAFTNNAFSQAAETPKEEPAAAPLTFAGNVDVYYRYSSNKAGSKTSYTDKHNSIALGMANLQVSKDNGKIGFMADLMFGPRAEATNYNDFDASSGKLLSNSVAAIKQLYVTYKPTDKLKFTAGNFMTFVGYELVEACNNLNYSMSYNYTNGPFFHTGLKADIAFTENFGAMIGVFNRTDYKYDAGPKYVGGQLSYVKGNFKVYANFLTGQDTGKIQPRNTTVDLTTSYQVTPKLGLGLNLINKSTTLEKATTSWFGTAFYANVALSDKFVLAGRGEFMSDKDGYLFGESDNSVTAFTLTGNIKLDALTIMPEIRIDNGSKAVFLNDAGVKKKGETSFILAATYKF